MLVSLSSPSLSLSRIFAQVNFHVTRSLNLITLNVMDAEIRSDLPIGHTFKLRTFTDLYRNSGKCILLVPSIYLVDLLSCLCRFSFFFFSRSHALLKINIFRVHCLIASNFVSFFFIRTLLLLTHQTINNSTFWWESQHSFCCITSLLSIFFSFYFFFVTGKYKCHDLARRPFNA